MEKVFKYTAYIDTNRHLRVKWWVKLFAEEHQIIASLASAQNVYYVLPHMIEALGENTAHILAEVWLKANGWKVENAQWRMDSRFANLDYS
jgi:hypothetical protein